VSHSDTKVWYHSLQSSAGPPLLCCLRGRSQAVFQGWVLTLFLSTADHPGKTGLLWGRPTSAAQQIPMGASRALTSLAMPRLAAAQALELAETITYVALGWVMQMHPTVLSCTAQLTKENHKSCISSTRNALERPKGGFFWLCACSKAGL